ncbi:hypothetical protein H7T43_15545 [Peribacillus simplex]|nr:hypothetical protein [Peribacillus simplex]
MFILPFFDVGTYTYCPIYPLCLVLLVEALISYEPATPALGSQLLGEYLIA